MTGQNFIQFPLLCQLPFSLSLSPKETGISAGCTKNVANVTTWWLLFPQLRSSQRKENTSSRRWTQTKILSLCHVDRLLFHAFFFPPSSTPSSSSSYSRSSSFFSLSFYRRWKEHVLLSSVTIILEEITDTQSVAGCAVNFSRTLDERFSLMEKWKYIHTMDKKRLLIKYVRIRQKCSLFRREKKKKESTSFLRPYVLLHYWRDDSRDLISIRWVFTRDTHEPSI